MGVEVSSDVWHTVIALESGSVLLEVKAGSFDPSRPKGIVLWVPKKGSARAKKYSSAGGIGYSYQNLVLTIN